jgi:hypothetical protein
MQGDRGTICITRHVPAKSVYSIFYPHSEGSFRLISSLKSAKMPQLIRCMYCRVPTMQGGRYPGGRRSELLSSILPPPPPPTLPPLRIQIHGGVGEKRNPTVRCRGERKADLRSERRDTKETGGRVKIIENLRKRKKELYRRRKKKEQGLPEL